MRFFCGVGIVIFASVAGSAEPLTTEPAVPVPRVTVDDDLSNIVLPLERGNDLLFTDAIRINGSPVGLCVIDTGVNVSVFDTSVVRKLQLEPARGPHGETNAPVPTAYVAQSIAIGPIHTGARWVAMADLTGQFGLNPKVQGIIGGDLLGLLPFTLDPQKPALTFHARRTFQPPAQATKLFFELWGHSGDPSRESASEFEKIFLRENPQAGCPIVRVTLDAVPATALLDTGFTGRLSIRDGFTRLHPAFFDAAGNEQPFHSVTEQGAPKRAKIGGLQLFGKPIADLRGSVAFPPRETETVDRSTHAADVSIGRMILNNLVLTFDYERHVLWSQDSPMPSVAERLASGQLMPNEADLFGLTPLMGATRDGDVAGASALLKADAVMSAEMEGGMTVLHIAATYAQPELMALLLRQSAASKSLVNARTAASETALFLAATAGNTRDVALLLEAGADPNLRTRTGLTALHAAARCNDERAIHLLLDAGAAPDAAAGSRLTPVGIAAEHGSIAALDALANAGARLEGIQGDQIGLLHLAARTGKTEMIAHLLAKYPRSVFVNAVTPDGSTALLLAAESGHTEAVAALLKAGARPSIAAEGLGRAMPLHMAARNGNPRTITLLLDAHAPLDAPTKQGLTPLMAAAYAGQAVAVGVLLDAGASINAKDSDGMTAVHIAARENRGEVVRLLVKRGADPNAKGPHDVTPLHVACLNGAADAIEALIDCKADPNAVTAGGVSAIELARQGGNKRLIDLFDVVTPGHH